MGRRYGALRTLTALAVLFTFLSGAGNEFLAYSFIGRLVASLLALVWGGGLAVTLFAVSEGVFLMIALEENTRRTAEILERQTRSAAPAMRP